jgi:hypothetical protein
MVFQLLELAILHAGLFKQGNNICARFQGRLQADAYSVENSAKCSRRTGGCQEESLVLGQSLLEDRDSGIGSFPNF